MSRGPWKKHRKERKGNCILFSWDSVFTIGSKSHCIKYAKDDMDLNGNPVFLAKLNSLVKIEETTEIIEKRAKVNEIKCSENDC